MHLSALIHCDVLNFLKTRPDFVSAVRPFEENQAYTAAAITSEVGDLNNPVKINVAFRYGLITGGNSNQLIRAEVSWDKNTRKFTLQQVKTETA